MTAHAKDSRPAASRVRGTVYGQNGAQLVWIRDVSRTGALVASETPLEEESDVIFKRGPIFAAAHIVWVKDNSAGVQFYRPLPEDQLLVASKAVPGHDR